MFSFVRSCKEHTECHAGGPPNRWTLPSVSYTTRGGTILLIPTATPSSTT